MSEMTRTGRDDDKSSWREESQKPQQRAVFELGLRAEQDSVGGGKSTPGR